MDNLPTNPPPPSQSGDLQAQCEALRQMVTSVLVLLLIVSGTVTVYLVRQWKFSKNDLEAYRPQATQVINEYTRTNAPAIQAFVRQLAEYGRTHPDFAPIVTKYRLNDALGKTGAAATSAPPAAPVSKK